MENETVQLETPETKVKKKLSWWQKTLVIFSSVIGGIVALLLMFILVLNVGKWGIYHDYYTIRDVICTNHGMNDGYVSQGTAISDDGKYILTSGYMKDKTNSRVYITEIESDLSKYVELERSEKTFKGHCGGIAVSGDYVYIASNNKLFVVPFVELQEKDKIDLDLYPIVEVNNESSFVSADENYVYVGDFSYGSYQPNHDVHYEDQVYNAIVSVYDIHNSYELVKVFAIRDKVQGFAVSAAGGICLSTSWGVSSSHFYYYKESSIINANTTYDGAPLYVLKDHDLDVKGPAMAEDLAYANGGFYTNYESSCDKYIFGKFFINSNKIVKLNIEELL